MIFYGDGKVSEGSKKNLNREWNFTICFYDHLSQMRMRKKFIDRGLNSFVQGYLKEDVEDEKSYSKGKESVKDTLKNFHRRLL